MARRDFIWLFLNFLYSPPAPSQTGAFQIPLLIMFERGRKFERG
jgi:hypothetical protein